MNFILVGTNFKYSPIAFRERIAFSKNSVRRALPLLLEGGPLNGVIILSTCNRVEICASCEDSKHALDRIYGFLSQYHEIDMSEIAPYLYSYINRDAARHLFRVTSGLDSQVLGEAQILGQVGFFFEEAKALGTADIFLEKVFDKAIGTTRKISAHTYISKNSLSIADIALNLIKREAGDLKNKKALVIGLGKISEIVARRLSAEGVSSVFVSNRTYEKARELAETIGARAVRFDKLKENLNNADIIISATSSPHVVIKKEDLININRPILIIDLALPRDVEPAVAEIKGVELFNLDDLGPIKDEGMEGEIEKADLIIDKELDMLWKELIGSERELAPSH